MQIRKTVSGFTILICQKKITKDFTPPNFGKQNKKKKPSHPMPLKEGNPKLLNLPYLQNSKPTRAWFELLSILNTVNKPHTPQLKELLLIKNHLWVHYWFC